MTAWGEPRRPAERGADPNLCQNDGVSPLIKAAMAPGDAGLGAAALLLDAKADIDRPERGWRNRAQLRLPGKLSDGKTLVVPPGAAMFALV